MTTHKERSWDYQRLLDDLQAMIEKGRQRASEAVNEILTSTYWKMGRRLSMTREVGRKEAPAQFVRKLSEDLNISTAVLYLSLQFFRAYPNGLPKSPDARQLSWGSHVTLLPIKDEEQRLFYLKSAVEEGWSRSALKSAIKNDLFTERAEENKENAEPVPVKRLERPTSGLHTYVAIVERVIDGDTLEVRIDLGFDVWRVERIRLRGIDTPEIGLPEGKKARDFVTRALADTPFVVLRTYKTDKYARYVADLFYEKTFKAKERVFQEGRFLNLQLLKEGLARRLDLPV